MALKAKLPVHSVMIKLGLALASAIAFDLIFKSWIASAVLIIHIYVHEQGHLWAMRRCGIKTRGFYFVPLLGGVSLGGKRQRWPSRQAEFKIAIMGPVWGMALSIISLGLFFTLRSDSSLGRAALFSVVAGIVINLFNLLPLPLLDGGAVIGSIIFSFSTFRSACFAAATSAVLSWILVSRLELRFPLVIELPLTFFLWVLLLFRPVVAELIKSCPPMNRKSLSIASMSYLSLVGMLLVVLTQFPDVAQPFEAVAGARTQASAKWSPAFLKGKHPVTWDIDVSSLFGSDETEDWASAIGHAPDISYEEELKATAKVLADPAGWQAAGVVFRYDGRFNRVADPARPIIVIRYIYPSQMPKDCSGSYSCTMPRDSGCEIDISVQAWVDGVKVSDPKPWLEPHILNQDLGYCWGLGSEPTGLMGADLTVVYPSKSLLDHLHRLVFQS